MTTTNRDGFWWLDQIDDVVKHRAYDCACQVGGVDAMSIDTDWLRRAAETIRNEHRAMAERAALAEARIQAVRDLMQQQSDRAHAADCVDGFAAVMLDDLRRALDGAG